ncbi:MAG: alanine/glycine:cation symporter family protein [Bryobacterales bacterium]|nr:alanine/glycine:cation symporter family protein [Bryobacterales bacterium]
MQAIDDSLAAFATFAWGPWLLVLLLGGGSYFFLYSRMLPFRFFFHAFNILRGKYDNTTDQGDISHFRALSSALAGTIGLGNIGGVAVAIHMGGPGAIFWMWLAAFLGIATKFFTCTLAVLYRGPDSQGHIQGGPMYTIVNGLGRKWRPLAVMFSICTLVGALPVFQINQLVQSLREVILIPNGWLADSDSQFTFNLTCGVILAAVVWMVVVGGIQRIAVVASRLVPSMVVIYGGMALWILSTNFTEIPGLFALIVRDAFAGDSVMGGAVGSVIMTGIRRSAFSNEAGIGTEALAHGAARTNEPVREGLVAMLGPVIDTLIVCTATALIILSTDLWRGSEVNGTTLTAQAIQQHLPGVGPYLLVVCVFFFGTSTVLTYNYYGTKALGFLVGAEYQRFYNFLYVPSILAAAVVSIDAAVNLIDSMYALMAIPTTTSAIILAPKVMAAARNYFRRLETST